VRPRIFCIWAARSEGLSAPKLRCRPNVGIRGRAFLDRNQVWDQCPASPRWAAFGAGSPCGNDWLRRFSRVRVFAGEGLLAEPKAGLQRTGLHAPIAGILLPPVAGVSSRVESYRSFPFAICQRCAIALNRCAIVSRSGLSAGPLSRIQIVDSGRGVLS